MKTGHLSFLFACASLAMANCAMGAYSLAQKNFFALEEAAVMVRSEMSQLYAPAPQSLPFTGTFDSTGWTLSITGSIGGQAVNYSATGVYNSGTQTTNYTGGGTVGSDTWNGNGGMSFFDVFTEIELESVFNTHDTVTDTNGVKPVRKPDRENLTNKTYKTVDNKIIDSGEYYITDDGVVVGGPHTQTSSAPIGDGNASVIVDDAAMFATITGGNVTGTVVPEPSTLSVVLVTVGCGLLRRKRSMIA